MGKDPEQNLAAAIDLTRGVIAKYSLTTVQVAIEACSEGLATPKQQRVVAELLRAVCGYE